MVRARTHTCAEKKELREVANLRASSPIVSKAETLSLINWMERGLAASLHILRAAVANYDSKKNTQLQLTSDFNGKAIVQRWPVPQKKLRECFEKKTFFPLLFIDKTVQTLMKLSYFLGLEYKKKPKTTSMKLSRLRWWQKNDLI